MTNWIEARHELIYYFRRRFTLACDTYCRTRHDTADPKTKLKIEITTPSLEAATEAVLSSSFPRRNDYHRRDPLQLFSSQKYRP